MITPMWKLKIRWFLKDLKYFYYRYIHGVILEKGAMPKLGKTKFVDLNRKGDILQIIDKGKPHSNTYDEVRLIPFKEHHGVFVEFLKNGHLVGRDTLSFDDFNNIQNSESL